MTEYFGETIDIGQSRVTRNFDLVMIERRYTAEIMLGISAIALGIGLSFLSFSFPAMKWIISESTEDPELAEVLPQVLHWAAYIVIGLGGILLIKVFAFLPRRISFSKSKKIIDIDNKTIPFSDIENITFKKETVKNVPILGNVFTFTIFAHIGGKRIMLIRASGRNFEAAMSETCKSIKRILSERSPLSSGKGERFNVNTDNSALWKSYAAIAFFLGVAWSGIGYWMFPDYVLTQRTMGHGPLVWPFGIVIIAMGIITALRKSLNLDHLNPTKPVMIILIICYGIISWR